MDNRLLRRTAFLSLLTLASVSACTSDASSDSVVGTYTLRTVDGSALPVTESSVTINSETAAFAANLTVTFSLTYTVAGSPSTASVSGTYSVSGSTVTVSGSNGTLDTYAFTGGNTLTEVSNSETLVFKK